MVFIAVALSRYWFVKRFPKMIDNIIEIDKLSDKYDNRLKRKKK